MDLQQQLATALGDRYRVERELGEGGMSVVYLAEDLRHKRHVAIKVVKPELAAMLGAARFLREIEIAATLQHPNILPLYDSGESGGVLYYVMPFIEGESLRQRLDRETQLPVDVALALTREIGSALQYAHERSVIHRDIKPENVLLSAGHAVVADFGIARALQGAGDGQRLTATGISMGTPTYMAPEQAAGERVDTRADQYSLACTLYEMLGGEAPFTGPSAMAILARHAREPVPNVRTLRPTVEPHVQTAITRAMAKLPADRFASIKDFLDALDPPAPVARAPARWRSAVLPVAVPVIALAGWFLFTRGSTVDATGIRSIAVLPFVNRDSAGGGSYLVDGMTEGLIADLAEIGSLKVISRGSGVAAGGKSLAQIRSELGVDGLLSGAMARVGDSVHVSVRFIRAGDSTTILERDYRRGVAQLPQLQREITDAVTGAIGTHVARPVAAAARAPVNQRAYEAYLRGRFHMERGELEAARAQFEQAIALAPAWAPPNVGLASYYTSLPFFSDTAPAAVLPRARAALTQALTLDESLAEAHAVNGYIRAYHEWDWRGAEQSFRRAIELRPSYADAHFSYSRFLASRGRLDEAIAQIDRAVALDPLSLLLQANRALLDYFAGRYAEAEQGLLKVRARDSSDVTAAWGLALVAQQLGRVDEAIAGLEPLSRTNLNRKSSLGHMYGVSGRTSRARAVLAELREAAAERYVPSYYFALLHAGLGEKEQALRYLERAYEERSTVLAYLRIDPRLSSLRGQPRFEALARRLAGEG
jgi:eukaryotic-like serine/threonine-protein kinase